uniref:Uncharacterized protein n=1 Tax=Arundo donax TaxID=35708 RepID=A0A0A9AXL1_ARUDO
MARRLVVMARSTYSTGPGPPVPPSLLPPAWTSPSPLAPTWSSTSS